ncbi:MAG: baseplate hub protein, partial [Steroidobacteraceae bacterium]
VWGMRQADMQAVTVLFFGPSAAAVNARAILKLEADGGSGYLKVFEGQFQEAQANYDDAPDVRLHCNCATGYAQQIFSAPPSSFAGDVDIATLAKQLATQMGFTFEDNGITGTISTAYLAGTLLDQFRQLAEAGRFDYYFDAKSTLIVCPRNSPRRNQSTVVLSKATGLIGYPTLQRFGVRVTVLFSPAIELGSPIEIHGSQVPGVDGLWFPMSARHQLDSLRPGGQWFSVLDCYPHAAIAQ